MKPQRQPTPRQIQAWDAVDRLTVKNKIPPSILDLMDETGTTSRSVMFHRLNRGVKAGRLVSLPFRGGAKYVPAWWHRMIQENWRKYYAA